MGILDLVNLVLTRSSPDPGTPVTTWDSPGPGDSDTYLGIIGTWLLSSIPGPHLDLVSGVATWASPIPGDSAPYVGLLDLVNLVLTRSSPRPGDSCHHLGLTWTW